MHVSTAMLNVCYASLAAAHTLGDREVHQAGLISLHHVA